MCGIAGLICVNPPLCREDHSRVVARMCDMQVHRGPDDRGVIEVGGVTLGSSRLAILDLSAAGHMPMTDDEGRWIVYNGEVYNFQQVRAELERLGHRFHSRTDTEVVLHAYIEWGEACLDRLNGMFAFALFDNATGVLTLARDRFGKKPLYYTQRDGHILFASELKTLTHQCAKLEPNFHRLAEWSLYRNVDFGSTETLFAGIHSLPAGHLVEVRGGRMGEPRRYYAPEGQVSRESYERLGRLSSGELKQEIRQLLIDAVNDRMIADVPVGTFCSGGIDSSLITAIAAQGRKDVLAFNVAVEGQGAVNENVFAGRVADSLGIRLLSCSANGHTFRESLPRAIHFSDMPLTHPNSVFFLKVSELARSHGVLVVLSGEAADELFGGYVHRYRRFGQIKRLRALMNLLPAKLRHVIALAGYAADGVPITEFSDYHGLLSHATSHLDRFARTALRARCAAAYGFVNNETDREVLGAMLADVTNFLTPLLRRLDRMTMAASIESRAPFLDPRLVRLAVNLPLGTRIDASMDKRILKSIAADFLPAEIVYRKKVGFPLPIADYLAPIARPGVFADGFCLQMLGMDQAGLMQTVGNWRSNVNGFYNLLALEIWGRLFFFKQSIDDVSEHLRRQESPRMPTTTKASKAA